jgi:hypothetical protein
MLTTLLLPLLLAAQDSNLGDRPRHPLAPSLPQLTKQEEARVDAIIERFIRADVGKTDKATLKTATAELNKLGPETIFNLIEAFNRVANLEESCPAVVIGKKISMILNGSQDLELLTFAKENIGSGVTGKRHIATVKDLQVGCILRRSAVLRQQALASRSTPQTLPSGMRLPSTMSMTEMMKAAEKAKGPQLKMLFAEAEKRQSPQLLKLLATGAASSDKEAQKLGQEQLLRHIERQSSDKLPALLKHERPEVRTAAARVVGQRKLRHGGELIELLSDVDSNVQQAARQALVALAGGMDHGPAADADSATREAAIAQWRRWWAAQAGR